MPATARPHRPGTSGRSAHPRRAPSTHRRTSQTGRGRPRQNRQVGIGGVMQRRRPQKKSGLAGMLGTLRGAMPTGGRSSRSSGSSGRGKKGAGIALATAAAGFAISNRDKLGSMLHRDKGSSEPVTPEAQTPYVDGADPDSPRTTTGPVEPAGPTTPPAA
jgi:hypothetical protein